MQTFQDITSRLEQALAGISFDELGISDEVREQVIFSHSRVSLSVKPFRFFYLFCLACLAYLQLKHLQCCAG